MAARSRAFWTVFLLVPFAFLSLRHPRGRRLLAAAALFSLPMAFNADTRFLMSAVPFLALALGLAFANSPGVLPALALFQAFICWPAAMPLYTASWSWRFREIPLRAALRMEPESAYIARHFSDYQLQPAIEILVPKSQKIFSFRTRPEAYFARTILVGYESAAGLEIQQILLHAVDHPDLRRAAAAALKQRNVGFLMVSPTDPGAEDLSNHLNSWGIALIKKSDETNLYRSNSRLLLLAALFGVIVWQAATLPFTSAEAALWYQFVRPRFAALLITPGAWSGLLYGLLAKRSIGVFRLSELSLRLPVVLAGGVYLASFGKIPMSRRWWLLLPLAIAPVLMHCFSFAGGLGISLGACALALCHPKYAGVCLGFALAAAPQFGFVPGIVAAGFLAARGFWQGMERVVIPAIAIAFILLLIPLATEVRPHPLPPLPMPPISPSIRPSRFFDKAPAQRRRGLRSARRPGLPWSLPRALPAEKLVDRCARSPDYLWLGPAPSGAPNHPAAVLFSQGGVVLFR